MSFSFLSIHPIRITHPVMQTSFHSAKKQEYFEYVALSVCAAANKILHIVIISIKNPFLLVTLNLDDVFCSPDVFFTCTSCQSNAYMYVWIYLYPFTLYIQIGIPNMVITAILQITKDKFQLLLATTIFPALLLSKQLFKHQFQFHRPSNKKISR